LTAQPALHSSFLQRNKSTIVVLWPAESIRPARASEIKRELTAFAVGRNRVEVRVRIRHHSSPDKPVDTLIMSNTPYFVQGCDTSTRDVRSDNAFASDKLEV
jgi:hypothetical protein